MAALPWTVEVSLLAASGIVAFLGVILWVVRSFYGDDGDRPESPPPAHGRNRRPPGAS